MERYKIVFDSLAWQVPAAGVRFKVFRDGSMQVRLVEFTSGFVEHDWCEKGHIRVVLKGELEIDFRGRIVHYPEGSGIFIPVGPESGHKAGSVTSSILLFLVEEV
ncbi:MAG: phosrestin [Bacillota bacterium]